MNENNEIYELLNPFWDRHGGGTIFTWGTLGASDQ